MSSYFITGATGYIGRMIIKKLRGSKEDAQIFVLARDAEKASRILPYGVKILVGDITNPSTFTEIEGEFDYLIHAAAVTQSREMIAHPVETADSIVTGTRNILDFAFKAKIKSMVYLSSMEVYGNVDCSDGHRAEEDELGDIDIFNLRSCYPLGKRMAEHYCFAYAKEYGVPVKIARLAQTFGRGVPFEDSRVFAQFARAAMAGSAIVLHTEGGSMGNYCAIDDVIAAIELLLDKGESGEAYNVANEANTMTIREMAELVAREVGMGKIKIAMDIPSENIYGYASNTGLRLSSRKLAGLGWMPKKNLSQMYQDLIRSWQ